MKGVVLLRAGLTHGLTVMMGATATHAWTTDAAADRARAARTVAWRM